MMYLSQLLVVMHPTVKDERQYIEHDQLVLNSNMFLFISWRVFMFRQ